MASIIYCRVSSIGQNTYNKSVSLQTQEQICFKFAHENKLRVKSIYKEVHSAFNKTPKILNNILHGKYTNQTILISSVDRYSRNVNIGLKLAVKAFKNKNKLVFIQEKFVCESSDDLVLLKSFLQNTEQESKIISNRIKTSRSFLINNGMFAGGAIPYGYNVIERKLVKNEKEQNVIEFIKICMQNKLLCDDLNRKMLSLTTISPYIPINCYDKNGNNVSCITEPLTLQEISDLLNSYGVLKRGILWCPRVIKTALKHYDPNIYLDRSKLMDWTNCSKELESIKMGEIKSSNNLGLIFDFKTDTQFADNEISKNIKLRRSARLNSYMDDDINQVSNDDDVEMTENINLFEKYSEFQRSKQDYKKIQK